MHLLRHSSVKWFSRFSKCLPAQLADLRRKTAAVHLQIIRQLLPVKGDDRPLLRWSEFCCKKCFDHER